MEILEEHDSEEVETFGDPGIASAHGPVPTWLKWVYFILPIWGLCWFYLYWNGTHGWLDRGYWQQLQRAANTTYPIQNLNDPGEKGVKQSEKLSHGDSINNL